MKLGQSVIIKGEVQTSEDLVLNGQVEGRIDLPRHVLTVGIGARIQAEIVARSVIVLGAVAGRVTTLERPSDHAEAGDGRRRSFPRHDRHAKTC